MAWGYFLARAPYQPASISELLMPPGLTCRAASTDWSETVKGVIWPSPHATRMGTAAVSSTRPPPTDMKSFWQAWFMTCPALKSAPSSVSTTTWRPSMPPAALHQSANALANWGNSWSSPGCAVLLASVNTAMSMDLSDTPRTLEAPPGPGPQIWPTPGHTPLAELEVRTAAEATELPAKATVEMSTIAAAAAVSQREILPSSFQHPLYVRAQNGRTRSLPGSSASARSAGPMAGGSFEQGSHPTIQDNIYRNAVARTAAPSHSRTTLGTARAANAQ